MEDLSFHFRSPGDLSDDELEEITNFLSERMNTQEASELNQLHHFYNTLACVAHKNHWMCSDRIDMDRCEKLRGNIRKYFIEGQSLESSEVTPLTFRAEHSNTQGPSICKLSGSEESQLRGDIRGFINQYSHEHTLSGRAIARVFHGIGSPCFPAEVWGKVRRFWRSHLHTDFNLVRKLATEALIGR